MTALYETPSSGPAAALAARMQALVPVIETERLILRAPRIEDFDLFAEAVLSPRGRFFGHHGDRESAWGDFVQMIATWYLRGHGAWTVTDRRSGTALGFVHIGAEPGDMEPELGYIVSADAEGRGIAHEASEAVREHAFDVLGFETLVACIEPENTRSAALARRLGAERDPAAEAAFGTDEPVQVFRHTPGGLRQ